MSPRPRSSSSTTSLSFWSAGTSFWIEATASSMSTFVSAVDIRRAILSAALPAPPRVPRDACGHPCRRGGLRARPGRHDVRGDGRAARHGDPPRPARTGRAAAAGARARRAARHLALDAAPGADRADPERAPRRGARARRRLVRRRPAAARRVRAVELADVARAARLPRRGRGRRRRARGRARGRGRPRAPRAPRRRDARGRATSRSSGRPTCSSTSGSPRPPARRGSWRR